MTGDFWSHRQITYALVFAIAILALADASVQWFQGSGIAATAVGELIQARRLLRIGTSVRRIVIRLYAVWLLTCTCLLLQWHFDVRQVLSSRNRR